jgi:hypothetical protein
MVEIIVDMNMLTSGQGLDKSALVKEGIVPEEYVYEKYGIDSLQFIKSNEYYAHDIDRYQDIYAGVKKRLNEEKAKFKKLNEEEKKDKKIQDSLRRDKNKRDKKKIVQPKISKALEGAKNPSKIVDTLRQ